MQVRLATEQEYEAIGQLTAAAYLSDGLLTPDDAYLPILHDAAARATKAQLWVAESGGELLGTVTYCPPGSAYRELAGPDQGEFRTLAVGPAGRGRGAGTALVNRCLALARAAGHASVVISTLPEMVAAHSIYRRAGFEREPARDWSPLPGRTLWAFSRPLTGADLAAELTFEVGHDDTAAALGSGSLDLLGTPRLLAWCEAATCAALDPILGPGETSVGVEVSLRHLAATGVGERVRVRAESEVADERRQSFVVRAESVRGEESREIGNGRVTRVVVDSGRFMSRVG